MANNNIQDIWRLWQDTKQASNFEEREEIFKRFQIDALYFICLRLHKLQKIHEESFLNAFGKMPDYYD